MGIRMKLIRLNNIVVDIKCILSRFNFTVMRVYYCMYTIYTFIKIIDLKYKYNSSICYVDCIVSNTITFIYTFILYI